MCNVLNQCPGFFASDTSPASDLFHATTSALTHSRVFQSELAKGEVTHKRLRNVGRAVVEGWYEHRGEEVIFDKDRTNSWLFMHDAFHHAFPESYMIVLVRDPREILASVLRNQARDPLIRMTLAAGDRSIERIATRLFAPDGLVGSALRGIENLLMIDALPASKIDDYVVWVQYERFVENPLKYLSKLHRILGEPKHEYDLDNVIDVSEDRDEMNLGLFPHVGAGKVEPRPETWPDLVPPRVAAALLRQYPLYSQTFNYAGNRSDS